VKGKIADIESACDGLKDTLSNLDTRVAVLAVKMAGFAAVGGIIGSAGATMIAKHLAGGG